jgi:hypothetical protein
MSQDEDQLRLLSIFHFVCAGIAALFACFPIFHLLLGLMLVLRPDAFGHGRDQPPAFMGWFIVLFASVFILFGWSFAALVAWAGRCLRRRERYMFCLVVAGIECIFMPFGTVLGIFTIMVLMRPSVKTLFEIQRPPLTAA